MENAASGRDMLDLAVPDTWAKPLAIFLLGHMNSSPWEDFRRFKNCSAGESANTRRSVSYGGPAGELWRDLRPAGKRPGRNLIDF